MKKLLSIVVILFTTLTGFAQQLEWMKTVPGGKIYYGDLSGGDEVLNWLSAADLEGNGVFAGHFLDSLKLDDNTVLRTNNWSVFITKLSPSGKVKWAIQPEQGYSIITNVSRLKTDTEGNVYLSGFYVDSLRFGNKIIYSDTSLFSNPGYTRPGSFWYAGFVVKFNASGQCMFLKNIVLGEGGGSEYGEYTDIPIAIDPESNLIVSGACEWNKMKFDNVVLQNMNNANSMNTFLVKYSSLGDLVYVKQHETTTFRGSTEVVTDAQGNIFQIGRFQDYFKADGKFYITNSLSSLIKFDKDGNCLWVKDLGDYSYSGTLSLDSEGNIIVGGHFYGNASFGQMSLESPKIIRDFYNGKDTVYTTDICIQKFDGQGQRLWLKHVSGPGNVGGYAANADHEGNIYISGSFDHSVLLDTIFLSNPPVDTSTYTSNAFIAKLSPEGETQWAKMLTGYINDSDYFAYEPYKRHYRNVIGNLSYSPAGSLYFWGAATKNATWGGAPVVNTSTHDQHLYMARVSVPGNGNNSEVTEVSMYPNPASQNLIIQIPATDTETISLNFYNPIGQVIRKEVLSAAEGKTKFEVPVQNMAAGMYILQVIYGDQQDSKRIFIAR